MGTVKIFTKRECPKCPAAKDVGDRLKKTGITIVDYDLETTEGLAEAAFHGVMATPTIIVEDGKDNEVAAWRGTVPSPQEVEGVLKGKHFLSP
jgi:glutaredoxin